MFYLFIIEVKMNYLGNVNLFKFYAFILFYEMPELLFFNLINQFIMQNLIGMLSDVKKIKGN